MSGFLAGERNLSVPGDGTAGPAGGGQPAGLREPGGLLALRAESPVRIRGDRLHGHQLQALSGPGDAQAGVSTTL